MIIKQVKLYNIRSYYSTTINFDNGITLLTGDIGSGKSSILLAIEFALFGFIKGTVNGDTLLRKGSQKGYVELHFSIYKKNIIIQRTLNKSKNTIGQGNGFIIIDDIKEELTPKEIKSKVLNLLGYPQSLLNKSKELLFRYTVYTPQELMKDILIEQKDSKLDTIRKLFDVEKYKTIKGNLTLVNQYLNNEIHLNNNSMQNLESNFKELNHFKDKKEVTQKKIDDSYIQIKEIDKKLILLEKENITIQKELDDYKIQKNKLENINKILSDKTNQNNNFENSIKNYTSKKNEISKNIKDIDLSEIDDKEINLNIIKINKEISNKTNSQKLLNHKIEADKRRYDELNHRIMELRKKILNKGNLEKEIESLKQKITSLAKFEQEITSINHNKNKIEVQIIQNETNLKNSREIINNINSLKKCPKCQQEVNESHKNKIITDENNKINSLKQENETLLKNKIRIELEFNNLNKLIKESSNLKSNIKIKEFELTKIKEYENEKSQLFKQLIQTNDLIKENQEHQKEFSQEDIDKLKITIKELNEKLESIRKHNNEVKLQKQHRTKIKNIDELIVKHQELIQNNNKEIIELKNQKQNLESNLKDNRIIEKHNEFMKIFENTKKEKQDLSIEYNVANNELKNINDQIKKLEEDKEKLEKSKIKLKKIKSTKEWITSDFVELISLIEKQTLAIINQQFNEYFQEWFSLLIEYNISARIDDEFNIIISVDGYDYNIMSLSGGEKTAIALAYRLALNQVINSVQNKIKTKNLLILDEPTDGFSNEQLDRVRDVLKKTSAKQIIVVSHENTMEGFADNIIRIEKVNNQSEII